MRLTPPLAEVEKHRLVSPDRSATAFSRRCSLHSAGAEVVESSRPSLANFKHQGSTSRLDRHVRERCHEARQPEPPELSVRFMRKPRGLETHKWDKRT
jgi:hypothetical protein